MEIDRLICGAAEGTPHIPPPKATPGVLPYVSGPLVLVYNFNPSRSREHLGWWFPLGAAVRGVSLRLKVADEEITDPDLLRRGSDIKGGFLTIMILL